MQRKADEGRAASMTLSEACGGAPECVENLEAALQLHGAMIGSSEQTLIIRREVRHLRAPAVQGFRIQREKTEPH